MHPTSVLLYPVSSEVIHSFHTTAPKFKQGIMDSPECLLTREVLQRLKPVFIQILGSKGFFLDSF